MLALMTFEFKRGIGGIIRCGFVGLASFIPALRNMRRADARDGLHLAKQIVQHIAPMADHIQDDAAAVFAAVVPTRALDGLQIAFKHPISKLDTHGQHLPEESRAAQHIELAQAGQEEFVLHCAML